MFVKSSTDDASLGIAHASVVSDERQLKERIEFIHQQTHSDALVEEFIEGRELYVGVIGNDRLKVMPVWEMTFGSLPEKLPAIATRKVKWDRSYQKRYGITTAAAPKTTECAVAIDGVIAVQVLTAKGSPATSAAAECPAGSGINMIQNVIVAATSAAPAQATRPRPRHRGR